jgi:outer membrane protein assembly factor BamB
LIVLLFRRAFSILALLAIPASGGARDTITNQWSARIGSHSDASPAIGTDGAIYFGTWNGKLWALNPDGTCKWTFPAGSEIKSSPAVGRDGTVYFGSRDRKFYAVRPDGKKKWEFGTGGWVDSSPALARDGAIYFGSWDKRFYALNPEGTEKWRFQTGGEIVSSPAIGADGTIYFGSHDKKFYALEPDGRKKWEFATGGQIISSPALNQDECLYFTSVDGYFYALNLDGRLRWRLRTGGITESSPVIGLDGTLYVGVNEAICAITPEGKKKWDRGFGCVVEGPALVLSDGSICFVASWEFFNMDPDLVYKGTFFLNQQGCGSPAVGRMGTIYVSGGTVPGGFSALQIGVPLAQTPWPKFHGNARNTGNVNDEAQ